MTETRLRAGGVRRPRDEDVVPVTEALRWQQEYLSAKGAGISEQILAAVVEDLAGTGGLRGQVPPQVRFGDLVGLRILATVHRLALLRAAPAVAVHLPTLGGTPPSGARVAADFRGAVVELLASHPEDLREGLSRAPQTNETGRATVLRCGLAHLTSGLPVRLLELGASAGLNLRADHLPGRAELEPRELPAIVERRGCDLAPIDPTTPEGRLTLSSYVWVDDVDRFARLGRALQVAARVPARVERRDVVDLISDLDLADELTTVVWHSAFWIYLPGSTRAAITSRLEQLGRQASTVRRLARVSWEWADEGGMEPGSPFELRLQEWRGRPDDGVPQVLARGDSHAGQVTLVT